MFCQHPAVCGMFGRKFFWANILQKFRRVNISSECTFISVGERAARRKDLFQMEGKREPFKSKDNNRIVSKKEDKKVSLYNTGETQAKKEDSKKEEKKKSLFVSSKPSVTDKALTTVVNCIWQKEAPDSPIPVTISPSGPVLNECWEEELCETILKLDMHTEQEYAIDIFSSMMKNQSKHVLRAGDIPKAVTTEMRAMLVDWVVQVHEYLGLQEETLYLAVYLMNSYMKVHKIRTCLLQLLAASCLFIASKMEESLIPEPAELCFMMEDAFSKKELMKMERKVLQHLSFELQYTQPLHFLRILSVTGKCPENVKYLAMYFMELTLLEADGAMIEPALLACGALLLAQMVSQVSGTLTPDNLEQRPLYSYSDADLSLPRQLMGRAALRAKSDCKSIWQKYSRSQRHGVSIGPAMANTTHLAHCIGL
ncbi:cyclin-P isoform X2 [Hyla sarda]|uniref:cyclin-P isoform X2 n=1 Tax=Hyla sarda TaxID=327740 RepID=UPI0024C3E3BB|nr:cyclin-P isoform X2 [Hyla sarda]